MSFIQNGLRITLPEREVLGGVAAFGIASALGLGGSSIIVVVLGVLVDLTAVAWLDMDLMAC